MKLMIVLGTRPEIIRLSRIIPALQATRVPLALVHTGQNYHRRLSDIFFRELGLRPPDVHLAIRAHRPGEQIGRILDLCEQQMIRHRPDRLLILGDTNSGLCALVARRLGLAVYHMEAGNRCGDDRVPEEVNRRVIDHVSTVLLPYTHRSKENLLAEGVARANIFVTGNPIFEVLEHFRPRIESSQALQRLGLRPGGYFLLTLHRAENVDHPARLRQHLEAFRRIARRWRRPIVCSLHPRTRARLERLRALRAEGVRFLEPLGFADFVRLEKDALCVLTDSGTVQEECCIFGVPTATLRDVTERPETIECGSNVLAGCEPQQVLRAVAAALDHRGGWSPPAEYLAPRVSATLVKILTGFRLPDAAEENWRAHAG